jgi:O-antigen/teichoic acid export membrane protein
LALNAVDPTPGGSASRPRIARVVARLAAANSLLVFGGFITGPLQARALGPTGRGELAAVAATLGFAPTVASLGLGSYAMWAVARGRSVGGILGTTTVMYLALGALTVFLAFPLSAALSGGHTIVHHFLLIGLLALPASLLGTLMLDVALGLEMWRVVVSTKVVGSLMAIIPLIVLFFVGELTVSTAAIVTIACAAALVIPCVAVFRRERDRFRWERSIAAESVPFGFKAWLGGISSVTNGRLDQILMVDLSNARQLGLYAVAVSMSTVYISLVISAIQYAMAPRVARGESELVAKMARTTMAGSLVLAGATAIASPFALRYLFGSRFTGAEGMLLILLVGSLMIALSAILSSGVSSAGRPGLAARAEIYALIITIPGLLTLVGPLGGVGAAIVSVVAYGVSNVYLLRASTRLFGGRVRDYLVPRPDDFAFAADAARTAWSSRVRKRRAKRAG